MSERETALQRWLKLIGRHHASLQDAFLAGFDSRDEEVRALKAEIAELQTIQIQDEAEIRQLETGRFAPAERAVLEACAEMALLTEDGHVRVADEQDVALVAEAEWAKRQERGLAEREDGVDYVLDPIRGPVMRRELESAKRPPDDREQLTADLRMELGRLRSAVNDQALDASTASPADYGETYASRFRRALSLLRQARELLRK